MKNKGGRPILHGLEVITGQRINSARLALANGSSRRQIAFDVFNISPRTLRRYLSSDDPRASSLKSAIRHGELLRGDPLAALICMLIDKRDRLIHENPCNHYLEKTILEGKIKRALVENDELKRYLKADRRKRNLYDEHFNENIDPVRLEEMAKDLNLKPFTIDEYLYKNKYKEVCKP